MGGGGTSSLPTTHYSLSPIFSSSCTLICIFLHLRKSQLFFFHGIAHSSTKNRGACPATLLKIPIPAHSRRSRIRRGVRLPSQVQLRSLPWAGGKWAELPGICAVLSGGRERLSRSAGWKPNRVSGASGGYPLAAALRAATARRERR